MISGAFSVTQQAIQLGFMPRLSIQHTSDDAARADLHPGDQLGADDRGDPAGAVLPELVGNLAAAYGIAVTGAMLIDTCLLAVGAVLAVEAGRCGWRCRCSRCSSCVDGAYFAANLIKIPDGGWFPLLIGLSRSSRC